MASSNTTARSSPPPSLILFRYAFSPWSRKLVSYLALRRIPYQSCMQPITLPRPDLEALGVKYRRIPLMAAGKDIYCDSDLSAKKIEQWFPYGSDEPNLNSSTPEGAALEEMLNRWTEVTIFKYAAYALPVDLDSVFKNPTFLKDRSNLFGREWTVENQIELRKESDLVLRGAIEYLEATLLKDGRQFLLGERIGWADLHVGWVFHWLQDLGNCFPPDVDSASGKHRLFWEWVQRYSDAVSEAKEKHEEGKAEIASKDAIKKVLGATYVEQELEVNPSDPTGLKKGDKVEGWPVETGFSHRDVGVLVGLNDEQAVIENEQGVRIHHPRWLFKVEKVQEPNDVSHAANH